VGGRAGSGMGAGIRGTPPPVRNPSSSQASSPGEGANGGSGYQLRYQVGVSPAFRRVASGYRPEASPSTNSVMPARRSSSVSATLSVARAGAGCLWGATDGAATSSSGCRDVRSSAAIRRNSDSVSPRSSAAPSQRFRAAGLARNLTCLSSGRIAGVCRDRKTAVWGGWRKRASTRCRSLAHSEPTW
jgi:hypothetical protein